MVAAEHCRRGFSRGEASAGAAGRGGGVVHYRQNGRFLKATDDLPAGVAGQLADADRDAGPAIWMAGCGPAGRRGGTARKSSHSWACGV